MVASVKRGYLIGLMVLAGVAAAFTIATVVFGGSSGRAVETALLSAVGVGYLLLLSFAAFTVFDRWGWCVPAIAGALLSGAMMVAFPLFAYIVTNTSFRYPRPWWVEFFGNVTGTGMTTAGLLCLAPLVLSVQMKLPGRVIQLLTGVCYAVSYVLFQCVIWGPYMGDTFFGWFASFLVLTAAGSLTVFFLHRFFGIKVPNPLGLVIGSVWLRCPRCQKEQDLDVATGRCVACKLKIKVEVEEPVCPKCGYNLHQLTQARCPECGEPLLSEEVTGGARPDLIR